MSFGTTGGRGFEVPGAHYIWGALVVLAAALWLWGRFDLRRHHRDEDDKDGNDD